MKIPLSLFDRLMRPKRALWVTLIVSSVFFTFAFIIGFYQYGFHNFFYQHHWRSFLLPPTMITYILVITPKLSNTDAIIAKSLRPLIDIEQDQFDRPIRDLLYISPTKEIAAISVGFVLGFIQMLYGVGFRTTWLDISSGLVVGFTYGMLAWVVYLTFSTIKFVPRLLSQPHTIDPLDITPFRPIGKQSLLLGVTFAGGITLAMIFTGFEPGLFQIVGFWLWFTPLLLSPVIFFFINMIPTNRAIATAKEGELKKIQKNIHVLSRDMIQKIEQNQPTANLPAEINALNSFEQRLKNARTWPFNFSMLRTLFFSMLSPLFYALLRLLLG